MFSFNLSRKPISEKKVRQAIAHCINRQEILTKVFGGVGDLISHPVAPSLSFYEPVKPFPLHYAAAKRLLSQAGFPDGFKTSITTSNSFPHLIQVAQVFKENLAPAGIQVELDIDDWHTTLEKWARGEFDIATVGLSFSTDPHTIYSRTLYSKAQRQFFFGPNGFSNEEIDRLITQASVTADFNDRKSLYTRIAKISNEEVPWIFTVFEKYPIGWRSEVNGFEVPLDAQLVYSGGGLHHIWLDR